MRNCFFWSNFLCVLIWFECSLSLICHRLNSVKKLAHHSFYSHLYSSHWLIYVVTNCFQLSFHTNRLKLSILRCNLVIVLLRWSTCLTRIDGILKSFRSTKLLSLDIDSPVIIFFVFWFLCCTWNVISGHILLWLASILLLL